MKTVGFLVIFFFFLFKSLCRHEQLYEQLCLYPSDRVCSEMGRECNTANEAHMPLEEGEIRTFYISVAPICQLSFSDPCLHFLSCLHLLFVHTVQLYVTVTVSSHLLDGF